MLRFSSSGSTVSKVENESSRSMPVSIIHCWYNFRSTTSCYLWRLFHRDYNLKLSFEGLSVIFVIDDRQTRGHLRLIRFLFRGVRSLRWKLSGYRWMREVWVWCVLSLNKWSYQEPSWWLRSLEFPGSPRSPSGRSYCSWSAGDCAEKDSFTDDA